MVGSPVALAGSQAAVHRQVEVGRYQVRTLEAGSPVGRRQAGTQEADLLDSKPFLDVA